MDVCTVGMRLLIKCLLKTGDWPDYFSEFQYLRKYKQFILEVIIEIIHLGLVRYGPRAGHHVWLILISCGLFYILWEQFIAGEHEITITCGVWPSGPWTTSVLISPQGPFNSIAVALILELNFDYFVKISPYYIFCVFVMAGTTLHTTCFLYILFFIKTKIKN